jgi:hypothetical protein
VPLIIDILFLHVGFIIIMVGESGVKLRLRRAQ